jgi:ATP-binding cassette subfamily C (CFTR/MRP) protein 1
VLDVNGHISQQGKFDDLRTQEGFVSSLVLPDTSTEKKKMLPRDPVKRKPFPKALQGPSANDIADLARRTGDISLYKYYFASIGWKISLALLLTVCLNTLGSSFPRKLPLFLNA